MLALTSAPAAALGPGEERWTHPAALAPLLDAQLLGITPAGHVLARTRTASGALQIREWVPPAGPLRLLPSAARQTLLLLPAQPRARVFIRSQPALGGRPVQTLMARIGIGQRGCEGLAESVEAELGPLPPVHAARLRGPFQAGAYLIFELELGGRRSIEALDAAELDAGMMNRAALAAYGLGCAAVARALWEEALTIDAGFGDAAYNLACVSALSGDLPGAEAWLDLALAIDPQRYRRLMKFDPDLEALRRPSR